MKGVWEVCKCIELRSAFQNYTTVISSMEIHANDCVSPHKLNYEKTDTGGGPETKDYDILHYYVLLMQQSLL